MIRGYRVREGREKFDVNEWMRVEVFKSARKGKDGTCRDLSLLWPLASLSSGYVVMYISDSDILRGKCIV